MVRSESIGLLTGHVVYHFQDYRIIDGHNAKERKSLLNKGWHQGVSQSSSKQRNMDKGALTNERLAFPAH